MTATSVGRSGAGHYARTLRQADEDEARAFLAKAAQRPEPTMPTIDDLRAERAQEAAVHTNDESAGKTESLRVAGRDAHIEVRVTTTERPDAVVVNAHASGWVRGLASWTDGVARALSERFGVTTLAPAYRLAPEHPHPAGLDDILDVLRWTADVYAPEHGVERVFVLGSSAGAHLSALALLRAREEHPDVFERIGGVVFSYGIYDLSRTPSMRLAPSNTPVVSPVPQVQYMDWAFPDTSEEGRRDPSLSPLYADLAGLPPALFSACERDPLRDDSLFMAARWADAGNDTDLDIWADCVHSFDRHYPNTAQHYASRVGAWILEH